MECKDVLFSLREKKGISQQELADRYMLTDIGFARRLFKTEGQISKIEVRLTDPARLAEAKARLAECAGEGFRVEDKYEINRTFYAMMRSEKLAVFLILLFILLIASFNIIGSISMLILDKKEDLATYRAMGMTDRRIISVFRTEGMLITLAGCSAASPSARRCASCRNATGLSPSAKAASSSMPIRCGWSPGISLPSCAPCSSSARSLPISPSAIWYGNCCLLILNNTS